MRASAAIAAAAAVILVPAAVAAPPKAITPVPPVTIGPIGQATAAAAPSGAGANPVELSLTLRLELQCGRLGPGPIVVSLPAAMQMPATIARGTVLLNGTAPATLTLSGHVVTMTRPPTKGILCTVMAPGTMKVVFSRAARLGNPSGAGRYAVTVRAGRTTGVAHLSISE